MQTRSWDQKPCRCPSHSVTTTVGITDELTQKARFTSGENIRKLDLLTDVALIINCRLETRSLLVLAERKVGNYV